VPQDQPVIAIVDDDLSVRQALARLLRAMGWQPVTFASGEAFLAAAVQEPPDCAVLDVWLPERSGIEVLEEMTAAGLAVPVIVITGRDDIQVRARAMRTGAVAYLCKPVDDHELLEAIQRARRSKAAEG
jgi:FixJ family two-component response regulator